MTPLFPHSVPNGSIQMMRYVIAGKAFNFSLPIPPRFIPSHPLYSLSLAPQSLNQLPHWLKFDTVHNRFSGIAPCSYHKTLSFLAVIQAPQQEVHTCFYVTLKVLSIPLKSEKMDETWLATKPQSYVFEQNDAHFAVALEDWLQRSNLL